MNRIPMLYPTPPKTTQVPLDDAEDYLIPVCMIILRRLNDRANSGGIFLRPSPILAPVLSALHTAALVDLVPTRDGMHVTRRAER